MDGLIVAVKAHNLDQPLKTAGTQWTERILVTVRRSSWSGTRVSLYLVMISSPIPSLLASMEGVEVGGRAAKAAI